MAAEEAVVEETVQTQEVKAELKEEIKEEEAEDKVKEEIKEDTESKKRKSDEEDQGKKEKKSKKDDDEDRKEKKEKKAKKDKKEGEDEDDMMDMLQAEVDINACPKSLVIEGSTKKGCNGTYNLMNDMIKGRPSYQHTKKDSKDKIWYVYYAKGQWRIGAELGTSKYVLQVKDNGQPAPVEPYPFLWRSFDKTDAGDKFEVISHGMRVMDFALQDPLEELPLQPLEPAEEKTAGEVASPSRRKSHKKKEVDPAKEEKVSAEALAKKEKEAKDAAEEKKMRESLASEKVGVVKKRAKEDKIDAAMIEQADMEDDPKAFLIDLLVEAMRKRGEPVKEGVAQQAASDSDSSEASEAESESDAESSKSSSSSDSAPEESAAAAAPRPNVPVDKEKLAKQRQTFEEKIRQQLSRIADPKERVKKLGSLRVLMLAGVKKMGEDYGMEHNDVVALLDSLDKQFTGGPSAPKAAPPKHLLAKAKGELKGASTPPEDLARPESKKVKADPADGLPHRTQQTQRSKLKSPWSGKRTQSRITYCDSESGVSVVEYLTVQSYRSAGEQLWYHQPGATVICDFCSKAVPQAYGSLQGEPERSQFAQSKFLCNDCIMAGNSGH